MDTVDLRSVYPTLSPGWEGSRAGAKNLTNNEQVRGVLTRAGRRVDLEQYADSIVVFWNNRFTTVAGRSTYKDDKIELSSKLWGYLFEEEKREILIHEACHLFTYERHYRQNKNSFQGHGPEWREMMRLCGYSNPTIKLVRPMPHMSRVYLMYCKCDKHIVTGQMLARVRKGKTRLLCTKCGALVRLNPYGES